MKLFRIGLAAALLVAAVGLPVAFEAAADAATACRPTGDFNSDDIGDIAIGAPRRTLGGKANAGTVSVVYGASSGLSTRDQLLTQGPLASKPASGDRFGQALAVGDFDGDGNTDDLAIGVPGERSSDGAVHIVYGIEDVTTGDQFVQGELSTSGDSFIRPSGDGGRFGEGLVAGDFNGDDRDDLIVAAPAAGSGAGAIYVYNGQGAGLGPTPTIIEEGDLAGGQSGVGDAFGAALVVCDFDQDGVDDVAIGIPQDDSAGTADAGAVAVVYGGGSGLDLAGAEFFTPTTPGIDGGLQTAPSRFGFALAAGDVDGKLGPDLVVGAPRQEFRDTAPHPDHVEPQAGAVHILYADGSGVSASGSQKLDQTTYSPGGPDIGDRFGSSLALADFDLDGYADIAIGTPFEDFGSKTNQGEVAVVFGTAGGAGGVYRLLRQGLDGVPGDAEGGDRFGEVVRAGEFGSSLFGGASVPDLAIGAPYEDIGSTRNAGATIVIFGSAGLGLPGPKFLALGSSGLKGTPKPWDRFGSSIDG